MNSPYQWALRAPHQPTTFALILAAARGALHHIARAYKNRRDAALLASMDGRMLADIGLNRSDVRDAFSVPLWRDPTAILASRVHERRTNRARVTIAVSDAPPLVPHTGFAAPKTDRPARYAL